MDLVVSLGDDEAPNGSGGQHVCLEVLGDDEAPNGSGGQLVCLEVVWRDATVGAQSSKCAHI